jgi:hypothetical protein
VQLAGVRRQLSEARQALVEAAAAAGRGEHDPAYRLALRSRNLLFHATRGLAAARGEELPEMPVTGVPGGGLADHEGALAAIDAALSATVDEQEMPRHVAAATVPYARFLGWLRGEVGKLLGPK